MQSWCLWTLVILLFQRLKMQNVLSAELAKWVHKLNPKCWFDQKSGIYFHIYKWIKKFWRLATLKLTTTTTTKKNYHYESPIFLEDTYFLKIYIGKVFISFYISA